MTRALATLALGASLLAGCASSPAPNHHALVDDARHAAQMHAKPDAARTVIVIVGCSVPASVDRPQLVVSGTDGQTRIVDTERWIEPLREAVPRAVARTLSARLDETVVWRNVAWAPSRPDVRLALDVVEWASVPGALAAVGIAWHVRRGSTSVSGEARAQAHPVDASYAALVAAHREALEAASVQLSEHLARVLRESQH